MKPKIKPRQRITIHRDGTVSLFNIIKSQWQRIPGNRITSEIRMTLSPRDRVMILTSKRIK